MTSLLWNVVFSLACALAFQFESEDVSALNSSVEVPTSGVNLLHAKVELTMARAPSMTATPAVLKAQPDTNVASASKPLVLEAQPDTKVASASKPLALKAQPDTSVASDSKTPLALPMSSFVDPTPTAPKATISMSTGGDFGSIFEGLGVTVVRIQSITSDVDWFRPFRPPSQEQYVGSGFAVHVDLEDSSPVFVSNAHVVRNAKQVQVQMPVLGQETFEAFVPLICEDFDLAIIRLKDPTGFWKSLRSMNTSVQALTVRETPLNLGMEVAAVGFPLGSSSLKLSRGVISGTEDVEGAMCYQSTAPISPGSSGGPLFAVGKENNLQVIGVNFASSADKNAQNTNFVVPTVHVKQLINAFVSQTRAERISVEATAFSEAVEAQGNLSGVQKTQQPEVHTHKIFRLAPVNALLIEANDALYNSSGGCSAGVFLAHILPISVLRFAQPPVQEHSFIMAVNDVPLDRFGMGQTDAFLGDPAPFESLLTLWERIDDPIELQVCHSGEVQVHKVSMHWQDSYHGGVRMVEEPFYEPRATQFEIFAGITMMQLTVNHIFRLMADDGHLTMGQWLLPENQVAPRILVTHVEEGTYAAHVLSPGMIVNKVNGANMTSLESIQEHFVPNDDLWTLETDQGLIFAIKFNEALAQQWLTAMSDKEQSYLMTPAVEEAGKRLKLEMPTTSPPMSEEAGASTAALLVTNAAQSALGSIPNAPNHSQDPSAVQKALAFAVAAEKLAHEARVHAVKVATGQNETVEQRHNSKEDEGHKMEEQQRAKVLQNSLLGMKKSFLQAHHAKVRTKHVEVDARQM
mmetsp:Transcript_46457/g.92235  ORF Transcript_46457/g.92235 Transcript_46457/m.92235 type:complete len:803 (-) Transcript_46457:85-2493(-)